MHHFLRTLLYTSLLFPSFQTAYAQANWVTGYVVIHSGDTLRGQVDDRDWQRSPESVRFRPNAQTSERTYSVAEVVSFYVAPANQRFIRRVGPLNMDDPKASFLPSKPTPIWVADTVFMQVLQQGPLSLAVHRDSRNIYHYMIRSDTATSWQELLSLRFVDETNNARELERYKQQLFLAMRGCPTVQSQTTSAVLQENSLKKLVSAYNNCQGIVAVEATTQTKGNSLEWGLLGGAGITTVQFKANYLSQPIVYRSSGTVTAGLWAAYFLTKRRRQWAVYADLRYQGYAARATVVRPSYEPDELNYEYLKVYTGFRWQYPGKRAIKPFLVIGFSNGFELASSRTVYFNGERKHEQGLFAGLGIRSNRIGLELRYERGNGMSDIRNLNSTTSTVIGQLAYTF